MATLQQSVDELCGVVEKILTSKETIKELQGMPEQNLPVFWECFFLAVISRWFGVPVLPQESEFKREYLDRLQAAAEEVSPLQSNPFLWLVVNFWDAEERRITSLVAHDEIPIIEDNRVVWTKVDHELVKKIWTQKWANFREINRLSSPSTQAAGRSKLRPHSIGNVVIADCMKAGRSVDPVVLSIGETSLDDAGKWPPHTLVKISKAIGQDLGNVNWQELLESPLWNASDVAPLTKKVSDKFRIDEQAAKCLILNAVQLMHGYVLDKHGEVILTKSKDTWHYEYCISTWSNSASYIYVSTKQRLGEGHLRDLRYLADRLLSLAWIADSVRRHTLSTARILDRALKAAKAAIFARNFSHVIGSHVISNPAFAVRLSPSLNDAKERLRAQLKEWRSDKAKYDSNMLCESPFDSMNRVEETLEQEIDNLSGTIDTWSIKRFHQYLQGRFDFIARSVTDSHDPTEPIFVVNDLLDGFLSQTSLLDTLVADLGYQRNRMVFKISLPTLTGRIEFRAEWTDHDFGSESEKLLTHRWVPISSDQKHSLTDTKIGSHDFLIGLPGGTVAIHAFYSLLENIIRNSIKYQENKDTPIYEISLQFDKSEKRTEGLVRCIYKASIFDSFSVNGPNGFYRKSIGSKIGKPLVNSSGEACTSDLGIQEMKLCAASLRFKSSTHTDSSNELQLKAGLDEHPLTYQLTLEPPMLLGVLGANASTSFVQAEAVARSGRIDDFLERNCHVLVIDAQRSAELACVLSEPNQQRQLPFRVLVLGPLNTDCLKSWIESRRIMHSDNQSLYDCVFAPTGPECDDVLILRCYREWLLRWKPQVTIDGIKQPWLLLIGFEREPQQVAQAWNGERQTSRGKLPGILQEFNESSISQGLVQVVVRGNQTDVGNVSLVGIEESDYSRVLMFDNHGKCFENYGSQAEDTKSFSAGARFYQKFGSQTPELFRQLSTPPQNLLGFGFFICSLLESCLANIAIVDERLVANLLFEDSGSGVNQHGIVDALSAHEKAGIFPVFTFREADGSGASRRSGHFKPSFEKAYQAITGLIADEKFEPAGIRYATSSNAETAAQLTLLAIGHDEQLFVLKDRLPQIDVVLIHEGALDILKENGIAWEAEYVNQLYSIAPVVVRTSGRGRPTTKFPTSVPFIEFNVVSNAVLTSRNKYSLVRGLFGSSGHANAG